jgi:hypothetical protein
MTGARAYFPEFPEVQPPSKYEYEVWHAITDCEKLGIAYRASNQAKVGRVGGRKLYI